MDQSPSPEGLLWVLLNERFQFKNHGVLCCDLPPVAVFGLLQIYRQECVHSKWVESCETALVAN